MKLDSPDEEFNSPEEMYARYFQSSGRKYLEARSQLHKAERELMSTSGIMKRVSEVAPKSFPHEIVRNKWLSTCLYTCDAIAVHPGGSAKLVLDAEWDTTAVNHGVLFMSLQEWGNPAGSKVLELSQERIRELQRPYSIERVKRVKELQFLAGEQDNLDLYVDAISSIYNHAVVRLLRPFSPHRKEPSLRPLVLNSAYNISKNGDILGLGELDSKGCAVVGESKRNGNSRPTLTQLLALGKGKVGAKYWDQYVREAELFFSEEH